MPFSFVSFSYPRVIFDKTFYPRALVVAGDIDELRRKIRSFREPLNISLRTVIIPSIKLNFAVEGRPRWAPLAAETILKRKSAHPILQRTGRLRKVATQINIWTVERDKLYVSSLNPRVHYAKYHQGGTRHMPARPFMVFHREDVDAIERVFMNWLDRKVRESRF